LTYPALNNSSAVWFLVSGADKADAVARALAPAGATDETPARGVHGREETVWLLDAHAASNLGTS
jgi:6-phosphogluconolactonase